MDKHEIVGMFAVQGAVLGIKEYGSGHINRTELVEMEQGGQRRQYILQQINTDIFQNVDELMENIVGVTDFLRRKITARGKDPDREALCVIPAKDGASYCRADGKCYRMYRFIQDAVSFDAVKKPSDFYESALAFGTFQSLLADYPADTLHETIADFHNTPKRFAAFEKAVQADVCGRAQAAEKEIAFLKEREGEVSVLVDLLDAGKLPLRVTHNDTKLNNVMLDAKTGKGICVIDLDTVMPGLSVYDFGDSIRFGANTAAEDEADLSKVSLDLELYEQYVKGYLKGCQGSLTELEKKMLPTGAKLMTLECGMRFLTDYLSGDTYFRIHREHHNLDRCRTQLALVADMERKWEQMADIVAKAES
ncbi:MAG: aminoglycoside phosphotransferase family protein [Eubacterium sp.]|nr:aminoglycoside phosphotransferase family protein [Eubacterium sp.]